MPIGSARPLAYLAGIAIFSCPASARQQPPTTAPCAGPEYRQLDFWIGEWRVFDTVKGNEVATSRIRPIVGGCAIEENYNAQSPQGAYAGTSYSSFDRKDRKWHQLYVDVNGNVNAFAGGMEGPDMVLIGIVRNGAMQRMTYHRLEDGSVEQKAILSTDGGKSWSPGYDLTYRR